MSLHAKCVVVDDRLSLVTSANFTEAAHWRNIEAGVLVDDPRFAVNLRSQFDRLIAEGLLLRLPV
ncbi:MAG: phospholipase D-like domain-containing protein [Vicinamibacteria bacterium]